MDKKSMNCGELFSNDLQERFSRAYEYQNGCTRCTQLHTKYYLTDYQCLIYFIFVCKMKKMCAKRAFCVQIDCLCAQCVQTCA